MNTENVKTLADLVAYIEARFQCVEGLPYNRCQTGDLYVMIGDALGGSSAALGIIEEGIVMRSYPDAQAACRGALAAFERYAEGKTGVLYWRSSATLVHSPALRSHRPWWSDRHLPAEAEGWRVRLRLVISDKPGIYPTVSALKAARAAA